MKIDIPELCAVLGLMTLVLSLVFSWAFKIERRLGSIEGKLDSFCGKVKEGKAA